MRRKQRIVPGTVERRLAIPDHLIVGRWRTRFYPRIAPNKCYRHSVKVGLYLGSVVERLNIPCWCLVLEIQHIRRCGYG